MKINIWIAVQFFEILLHSAVLSMSVTQIDNTSSYQTTYNLQNANSSITEESMHYSTNSSIPESDITEVYVQNSSFEPMATKKLNNPVTELAAEAILVIGRNDERKNRANENVSPSTVLSAKSDAHSPVNFSTDNMLPVTSTRASPTTKSISMKALLNRFIETLDKNLQVQNVTGQNSQNESTTENTNKSSTPVLLKVDNTELSENVSELENHNNENKSAETKVESKYIIALLQIKCEDSLFNTVELNSQIYEKDKPRFHNFSCKKYVQLKFPVEELSNITVKKVEMLINSSFSNFQVIKIFNADNFDISNTINKDIVEHISNDMFGQREMIAYITATVSCGLLFLVCIVFCCIKLCQRKQTTSIDLSDIPHLNLKLENYKLTPIPRPSISFPDYGRDLFNSTYNGRASKINDGSVLSQKHFSSDIPASISTLGRDFSLGRHEMRTFNTKRPCSRVQSLDVRPNHKGCNNWMSGSREKLNNDYDRKNFSGIDNAGFKKWF